MSNADDRNTPYTEASYRVLCDNCERVIRSVVLYCPYCRMVQEQAARVRYRINDTPRSPHD